MINKLPFVSWTQAIAHWGRTTPEAIAVIEGEVSYSYATLALNVAQAAEMLRSKGLRRGMIVGIECNLQYLNLVLILGCEVVGAAHLALAPINLIFDRDLPTRCDLLCVETTMQYVANHPRVVPLSRGSIAELTKIPVTAAATLDVVQPPDEIVRISTTSGTTGGPKFVYNTRRSLRHIVASIQYTLKDDPNRYDYVSLYRFGQMGTYSDAMLAFEYGKLVRYCTDEDFLSTIRRHRACHTMLVVSDAIRFAAEASHMAQRADGCSIRVIGAALSPRLRAALRASLTHEIVAAYSSNETGYITLTDDNGIGTLLPDVLVRVVDDTGLAQKIGEPGIILARSPRMAAGYLWDEQRTEKHFADGWFRTSDIGVIPEPGKLIVIGWADDMLNIGGIKISPQPLEEQLRSIDGVSDAALLSVNDSHSLNALHVFIERPDPAASERIGAELVALLSPHVAQFTRFLVHCTDRFPRTATGKVQRNMLRDSVERKALIRVPAAQPWAGVAAPLATPGFTISRGSTMRSKSASVTKPSCSAASLRVRSSRMA
jgi:acyl-coenzyme A synthetase/AMP-(fatty) acid ligase